MSSNFKDEMKARYWDLKAKRDPIAAEITELKAKRNALIAEYQPRLRELEAAIHEHQTNSGLFDMDMALSGCLKALDGKPGRDPSLPDPEPETEPETEAAAIPEPSVN